MAERVLLIGKRAAVLTGCRRRCATSGLDADVTSGVSGADDGQLRRYAAVALVGRWTKTTGAG